MRASAVVPWLMAVACQGGAEQDAVLSLDGPERLAVSELGAVDGPDAVLEDGTSPEGVILRALVPEVAAIVEGQVHALGPGESDIVAEWQGQSVQWTLVVTPRVALAFHDPPARVAVGQSVVVQVEVDGVAPDIVWKTSDESIATVNAEGQVTGVSEGVAYITAGAGAASAMLELAVTL